MNASPNLIHKISECIRLLGVHPAPALERTLSRRESTLRRSAINEFAVLNGWKAVSSDKGFPPEKIGRRGNVDFYEKPSFFDHVIYFRAAGRNTAIVTQPYHSCHREIAALAEKLGLAWHVPPNPKASFHYPGHTFFFVLTSPDCVVKWLPEQIKAPA